MLIEHELMLRCITVQNIQIFSLETEESGWTEVSKVNDVTEVTGVSEVMEILEVKEVTEEFLVSEMTWEVSVA